MTERSGTRTGQQRRSFLKLGGLGAVAAGVSGTATRVAAAAAPGEPAAAEGYRETEHVKKYYELARF
jgi:hypothetical protein